VKQLAEDQQASSTMMAIASAVLREPFLLPAHNLGNQLAR
jgi:hypothetical protein